MLRRFGLTVTLLLGLMVALACSSDGGEPGGDEGLSRSAEAGGITVDGTWLTAATLDGIETDLSAYPLDEFVLVEIAFTTHSGDLNEIDMEAASALKQGDASGTPEAWVSEDDDSHHREGVLVFRRAQTDGPVELTVDLGDEEVALLWEAPPA